MSTRRVWRWGLDRPTQRFLRSERDLRGQALIELAVALIALVPLFLGISWLGRVIDLRQATIAAARQAAFECTVRVAQCATSGQSGDIEGEVRRRVFGAPGYSPLSGEQASGRVSPEATDRLWVDRLGQPLLERFEDVTVEIAPVRFNTPFAFAAGQGDRAFPGAVRVLSDLAGPGRFGLPLDEGLLEARVQVEMTRSGSVWTWMRQLTSMPLTLTARLTLLTDAWSASGPRGPAADSVEARVAAGAAVPVVEPALRAAWMPVRALIATASAVGLESAAQGWQPWSIDVDRVPADRLGDATAQTPLPLGVSPTSNPEIP